MERIKLALEKARESADQLQREKARAAHGEPLPLLSGSTDGVSGRAPGAHGTGGNAGSRSRRWTHAVWPLMGLAVAGGLWFTLAPGEGGAAVSAGQQGGVTAASAPQVAAVVPPPPVEPAPPPAADKAAPTGGGEPGAVPEARDGGKPPVLLATEVESAVEAWRKAWSTRDMVNYLDAYSGTFAPADGVSRQDWLASRYRNVGGRPSIEVAIRNVKIEDLSPGRARVSFLQDYASGSVRETQQPKTLDLALEGDGRWRIVGEWQGKVPPLR